MRRKKILSAGVGIGIARPDGRCLKQGPRYACVFLRAGNENGIHNEMARARS